MDEVTITCVLAKSSAVTIGGEDGEARIKLEAPASEIAEVMKLAAYGRGIALEVRVRPQQASFGEIRSVE